MWRLLPVTLVLALLGGCAGAGVMSGPGPGSPWECTPIDPLWQELPADPCFRAVLSAENEITLQWRVVNSQQLVYIYDDFGSTYEDLGFKKAICTTDPGSICSSSLIVTEGGFQRWLLEVEHPAGKKVNVSASITVPAPFPLVEVTGGGFVDMLAPTGQSITWVADPRNAALDQSTHAAWVEILYPGLSWWGQLRLPRSGPHARLDIPVQLITTPTSAIFGSSYGVRDCHLVAHTNSKFCSQAKSVKFTIGSDRFLDTNPLYTDAHRDLEIFFTNQSGDERRLYSPTLIPPKNGLTFLQTKASSISIDANMLTPGSHTIELMSCVSQTGTCSPSEKLEILVDSKMDWTLGRDYLEDFLPGVGYAVLGNGDPLDITYDTSGGIWLINEFSNSVEYVTPSGSVESFTLPMARQSIMKDFSFESVKPFAWNAGGKFRPVNFSALGERATRIDSKIWFTQGGGMLGPKTDIKNHSRVISYDPSIPDSLATPYDDGFCVYNIPTDDSNHPANNQVIGLTGTAHRIWIGEARAFLGPEPSAISSFIPDPDNCENLLNFEDPQALAKQNLQYCDSGKTPEQDGCMELILLDGPLSKMKVAHLEKDPIDDTVWFTDMTGRYLGHLNPDREEVIVTYPIPDPHANLIFFGGFPWSLRVDDDAVYFGEYSSRDILRFDKATATFDEIQVPVAASQVTLHSIDIDSATDRLWFTLANESPVPVDRAASTIGYIDLASWREHVANPKTHQRISGVIYAGFEKIAASSANPDQHRAFRGIAVDPASGKIALATAVRRQITELTPKPGFWP